MWWQLEMIYMSCERDTCIAIFVNICSWKKIASDSHAGPVIDFGRIVSDQDIYNQFEIDKRQTIKLSIEFGR